MLKITIDRQEMVKPKKENEKEPKKDASFGWIWHRHEESGPTGQSGAGQSQAVTAATPASAEKPAAAESAAETTSPAHATMVLTQALDNVFASGLDARVVAAMPAFWKLYYQAVAAKSDYRPTDPAVLRQDQVDRKAKLLSITQPDSNQYAQDAGVAGMALYHVVVGPDGNAHEIAVARPIGFGLDENAVAAIRKAAFQPALEAGKPVPVLLDLVVEFRIYSKRTDVVAPPGSQQKSAAPVLPGPYSVQDK
jgi:TonB family protein